MDEDPQNKSPLEEPESRPSNVEIRLDDESRSPPILQPPQGSIVPPKPPSLRIAHNGSFSSVMTPSSAPLGQINAARRPAQASGLTSDIAAKMKAFSLSRQGMPAQSLRLPPGPVHSLSTNNAAPSAALVPGALSQSGGLEDGAPPSPKGMLAPGTGGLSPVSAVPRPQVPNWNSSPQINRPKPQIMSPRPGMGGLAAKRGIKGGGMKLSDASGPPQSPSAGGTSASQHHPSGIGSAFSKYSNIIDTMKGTLSFANKAVIHGGGIEFTSGTSFSISLDEVDTMDELGKGNYGTVYKVRHSRPQMRRPGHGLRGNMSNRHSSSLVSNTSSDDNTASDPAATGTGIVMAMKEIRLELDDAKFAAIIMELDVLHRCISPFIVSFYGAFFQEGSVYICLEFMDGGSIDKLYGDGIPESVLRKIALSTVMGLKCLKDEHNIIHRDVKPTNILANTRGEIKICDFGVSGNLVASIAKTNIGCQSYMAPERISGGGVVQAGANPGGGTYSVQSDVWSLGLTIIECAMGRYPYPPETYNNIFSQLSAIVDGDAPDLPGEGYSDAARDFVGSCLHKIPRMRPTYAMLLRHSWLVPLMTPPVRSEEGQTEARAEARFCGATDSHAGNSDGEVAEWVRSAIERKVNGKMVKADQPALHAAPLDAVPGSPLLDRERLKLHNSSSTTPNQRSSSPGGDQPAAGAVAVIAHAAAADTTPKDGKTVESPVLQVQNTHSMDFADRVGQNSQPSDGEGRSGNGAQAPRITVQDVDTEVAAGR